MTPVTQPVVAVKKPAAETSDAVAETGLKTLGAMPPPTHPRSAKQDDGTNQLLKWGGSTLGAGIFFALLTKFTLGGIGPQGPHTNSGWMALIVTMMCLPFGFLLFLLGALKWLRNRRQPNS